MDPRRRDGLLAGLGLVALLAASLSTVGARPFGRPGVAAGGVVGALAVETLFLRYPDRLLAAWETRGVPVAATVAVVAAGVVATRVAPWLVAAACWGLAAYLLLLASVLAGLGNPLAPLARER